jgi:hypothetical protein
MNAASKPLELSRITTSAGLHPGESSDRGRNANVEL